MIRSFRPVGRALLAYAVLSALLAGAAASCGDPQGLYQGPRDSAPGYKREVVTIP